MASDYGALLALDSFATEESVRVAVYDRAMKVASAAGDHSKTIRAAELFLTFVEGKRWRLDILDVALRRSSKHSPAEIVVEKAEDIAEWVESKPEPELPVVETPAPAKKKSTRRKIGSK